MVSSALIGQFVTLLMMAIALGMDAFSVGMGMGMLQLRLRQIAKIGFVIGLFHVLMPFAGILIGEYLSEHFGGWAAVAGGVLLLLLGAQMIFSSFQKEEAPLVQPIGFGLLLFALSVSLDSFSVGLSLGIYRAKVIVTLVLFGLVSMVLTWVGLLIGKRFQKVMGQYSEVLGGCILFVFGLKLLLNL
ncbi:manganese efflux pump MntP family protein [Pullulanibacillus sp. KACC 23026]|uniref:manganese efflux pump MntP n=1 Tax=Pullulanibacillus sp. KACC 23026 TaxID=3028315 RepID=UPI0023AFD91F|nr:manganese efflux pump MntP family protein [Pullulanibacillus sp. KACC 23026]WEG13102.1 manganese efflux pump MntP family protein [Pullulanibacillus sp. KACC 23026]